MASSAKSSRESAVYRSCRSFPVFGREAMTWRWSSALPLPIQRCTCDARVVVHGKASSTCTVPIPQVASVVGLAICSPAHRCRVGLQADAGSDPCVSMPVVASAEVGMCTPPQLRHGSLPGQQSRAGRHRPRRASAVLYCRGLDRPNKPAGKLESPRCRELCGRKRITAKRVHSSSALRPAATESDRFWITLKVARNDHVTPMG